MPGTVSWLANITMTFPLFTIFRFITVCSPSFRPLLPIGLLMIQSYSASEFIVWLEYIGKSNSSLWFVCWGDTISTHSQEPIGYVLLYQETLKYSSSGSLGWGIWCPDDTYGNHTRWKTHHVAILITICTPHLIIILFGIYNTHQCNYYPRYVAMHF